MAIRNYLFSSTSRNPQGFLGNETIAQMLPEIKKPP